MDSQVWTGLYKQSYDLATDESNAHPAKASFGLAFKIIEHLEELGLLKSGDIILDPMAGTGRFLLAGAAKGYAGIAIELEDKFCKMLTDNIKYASEKLGKPIDITCIQGDSRNLSGLLTERGLVALTSPPYLDSDNRGNSFNNRANPNLKRQKWDDWEKGYSDNPANIGNLPDKPLVAVTSPPYGIDMKTEGGIDWAKANRPDSRIEVNPKTGKAYTRHNVYGVNTGGYGPDENNIGNQQNESYQSAMIQVYSEIIKVADVLAVVVKNPTRKGKLYPLDKITISLMEAAGWTIHCVHEARLFKEESKTDLFGETTKKPKGRISFFKLLSYRKGSPVADCENVIIATREGSGLKVICSPPYSDMADNSRHGDSGICGSD